MSKQTPILFFRQRYSDFRSESKSSRQKSAKSTMTYLLRNDAIEGSETSKLIVRNKMPSDFLGDDVRSHDNQKTAMLGYGTYRDGSTGAFNQDGLITKNEMNNIENELSNHNGMQWDAVFSLPDFETAARLDLEKNLDYQNLLKKVMPNYFKKNGLDEKNMSWVAMYHINTDNPHCHILFWEKNARRSKGKFKNGFEHEFKTLVAKELNLNHSIKNELFQIDFFEKKIRNELSSLLKENDLYVEDKLIDLVSILPTSGRIQYNSDNCLKIKPQVDELTQTILNSYLQKQYHEFNKVQQTIYEHEQKLYGEASPNTLRKKDELFERLGNSLLSEAKIIQTELLDMKKIDIFPNILSFKIINHSTERFKKIEILSRLATEFGKEKTEIVDFLTAQFHLTEKEIVKLNEKLSAPYSKKVSEKELDELTNIFYQDQLFATERNSRYADIFEFKFLDINTNRYKKIDTFIRLAKDVGKEQTEISRFIQSHFKLSDKEIIDWDEKIQSSSYKKINADELNQFMTLITTPQKELSQSKSLTQKYAINNLKYRLKSLDFAVGRLSSTIEKTLNDAEMEKAKMEQEIANQYAHLR